MSKAGFRKHPVWIVLVLVMLCESQTLASGLLETDEPIKLILNDWTSQIVLTKVVGHILEDMGYEVAYADVKVDEQWGAMVRGILHVQVEVWEGTMSQVFGRMVSGGGIVDLGSYSATTREEWWYPSYVEEQCPGLPDWRALKACADIFAVPETAPRGRYLAGPWEKPDAARIRALGLELTAIAAKDGNALWVELEKAIKEKRPIVLFNWTPNWVEAVYDGKFIEFPDYHPDCETKPEWGVNPEFAYDCGNPKNGWLKKAAWKGVESNWPCAFQMLKNMDLDNAHFARMAALVDVDRLSYDAAAEKWLSDNRNTWSNWPPESCKK